MLAALNMKPLNQDVPIKIQSEVTDLQSEINLVQKESKPSRSERSWLTKEVQLLLWEWSRLKVENGVLWRVISLPRDGEVNQLVLLKKQRPTSICHLHNEMGHLGVDRMFALARDRYFWPRMYKDVEKYITQECNCQMKKKPFEQTAHLWYLL